MMIRKPTHPGTIFLEDVMKPLNLSVTKSAQLLGVSRKALSEFINEKSSLKQLQKTASMKSQVPRITIRISLKDLIG